MINEVLGTIRRHNLINNGDRVLVGLSGGPDSVCLIHILCRMRESLQLEVCAVHVNHMLRGEEALLDERYAAELCEALGVPLAVERLDVKALAESRKASVEETGREERYRLFALHAERFGAVRTAVAHNRNDQAETVLMNMIRGTGLQGLKGIDYKRGSIIRPLLDIKRSQIEEYCRENGLQPRTDSSNLEDMYRRNKIRLKLIPQIDELFDCSITDSLSRMSEVVREDLEYIEEKTLQAFDTCSRRKTESEIELDIASFNSYHPAIRKELVRHTVQAIRGSKRNIALEHVTGVLELAMSGSTGSVLQLPGRLTVRRSYDALVFSMEDSGLSRSKQGSDGGFSTPLIINGVTWLGALEGRIETGLLDMQKASELQSKARTSEKRSDEQYFDYDCLINSNQGSANVPVLLVRSRQPGDIFKPVGSGGTKKLKEYFIDNKIPWEQRSSIPLIARGNEIIWVIGDKINEKFKISNNTKLILRIKYIKE